jgi:putative membrane protein insertion efficiency factor
MKFLDTLIARLLEKLIWFYQKAVSPWLGARCRFEPTCSEYALEVLQRYGAARGTYFFARRLLKCHPYHGGGEDPLPLESS